MFINFWGVKVTFIFRHPKSWQRDQTAAGIKLGPYPSEPIKRLATTE